MLGMQTLGARNLVRMPQGVADPLVRPRLVAWLRWHMKRLGINRKELAQLLGTSKPTVSNLLNGVVEPGLDTLVRMKRGLDFPVEQMLERDPPAEQDFDKRLKKQEK